MATLCVKSKTDVITNSSSEVYTCYFGEDVKNIERVINLILAAGGSGKTCSDLFTISLKYDYSEEELREVYKEVFGSEEGGKNSWLKCKIKDPSTYPLEPSRADIDRMMEEFMDSYYCDDGEMSVDGPMIEGIEIIAKDPYNEDLAKEISSLITNIGESLNVGFC